MSTILYSRPRILRELPLDRNVMVEASAGTGKTYTIEHIVARLLLETGTTIDRILVVTFTEKATGELRGRVRTALERIMRGEAAQAEEDSETVALSGEDIEKLRRALVAFDSAPIHTIHSFCRRVLSELAFATAARFGLELADGRAAFHEAMRTTIREALAHDGRARALVERWIEKEQRYPDAIEALLFQAHEARLMSMEREQPAPETGAIEPLIVDEFLLRIEERLERMKQERGLVDYGDMLSRLREAVSGDSGPALVAAIRARYSHALIDEFQDTDELQWEIFRRVFVESNGANPIFLIGDPKQAIYSFRGADVFSYLAARGELTHGADPVSLVRNFRATDSMIKALNKILDQRAAQPFFNRALVDIAYDHPVECGQPGLRARSDSADIVPIVLMRIAAQRTSAPKARIALGRFIAEEIHALLKDPSHAIDIRNRNEETKRVSADRIFILTRTTRESEEAGHYLRERGVPFAFYKQEGLFQTAEASDVLDVLGAIVDPSRRSNRIRAWASPFFAVPFAELPRLLDLDASHPLNDRLMQWKALADSERYAELFEALLYESGLADRELFLADSERELTNYQQIFEVLLEHASTNRRSISELTELLDDYFHERAMPPGSDRNVQRLESEHAAVQIMTIHKAKGLEADVVFLFGGSHTGNNVETQVRVYHEKGRRRAAIGRAEWQGAKDAIRDEGEDEDRRLTYVAVTRARARLYLPFYPEDSLQRKPNGYYQHLNRRLSEIGEFPLADSGGNLLVTSIDVGVSCADSARASDAADPLASWRPPGSLLDESLDRPPIDVDSLRQTRAGMRLASYTSLQRRGAPEIEVEEFKRDFESDDDARAGDLAGGAKVGVFLHEVIEQLDFSSFERASGFDEWKSNQEIRDLIERTMRLRQVADRRWLERAQEIVFNTLRAPIEFGGITVSGGLRACEESREMEFTFPIPEGAHPQFSAAANGQWRTERGFVTGYVDFIFRHRGLIYFADWKSDLLDSYVAGDLERIVSERYEIQKLIYSIGVVRLLGITNEREYASRFGGLLYVFLRGIARAGGPRGVYFHRPGWDEIRGYVTRLGAALGMRS